MPDDFGVSTDGILKTANESKTTNKILLLEVSKADAA